jgi:L-histidine Nalpha-methyltransferase
MSHAAATSAFIDLAPRTESFAAAVVRGLSLPAKAIDPVWFYDEAGSALFDRITDLPEYYPTRTEIAILDRHGAEMAAALGSGVQLIELGSGSSVKVRLLLDRLEAPAGYVGVDVSAEHLRAACDRLAADYPQVEVAAVCADYMGEVVLPDPVRTRPRRRVGFFPGSTIGNLEPATAADFLARWRERLRGGGMLIGVDLKKDPARLEAAYDDAAGVTAAFNLNLLARINRELGGTFDLSAFAHRAHYDRDLGRIEMHLVSRRDQIVTAAGRRFSFAAGEAIHTEISCKYTVEEFRALAVRAGYRPARTWTDAEHLFSVHWLEA